MDNRQALALNKAASPPPDDSTTNEASNKTAKTDGKDGPPTNVQPTGKRKYRRHAKPDENAPERPPSAYVIFSNSMRSILKCETRDLTSCLEMREDLKGRSLSFTEIAKLVGENWQTLSPAEKEPFEAQAFAQKEKYTIELAEYRQTENYKIYSEYLADFKAKQQYQLESKGVDDSKPNLKRARGNFRKLTSSGNHESTKRPKLENLPSQSSSNTVNSNSSCAHSLGEAVMQIPAGTKARQSIGSVPHSWAAGDAMVHQTGLPAIPSAPGVMARVRRDSVTGSIPWREQTRPVEGSSRPIELPIHGYARQMDTRPIQSSNYPVTESPHPYISRFPSQQSSVGGFTPPLLTTESTNSTVKSSISSGSGDSRISQSHYYSPRTPLDDPNRLPSLPMPSIYSGSKLPATFEGTLPPIRHTSLSPTSSTNVPYQSGASTLLPPIQTLASLISPGVSAHDHTPGLTATQRNSIYPSNRFPPVSHHNHPPTLYRHGSSSDDNTTPLDPIWALIDAGEIINSQQGQLQQKQTSNDQREQQQNIHRHRQR